MQSVIILLTCFVSSQALSREEIYYAPHNRTTPSGIAAYRSALTLDWLQAEDVRQRELVSTFEREDGPAVPAGECITYARPATGNVARRMLELLRHLEGDYGTIIPELIQVLIRNKMLLEYSMLDSEPDLQALVDTPGIMAGEPHSTFPRILTIVWLLATDPASTKVEGWCPISKVNKYMASERPVVIAKQMRDLDPVVARIRFIIEEFIQSVTPINLQSNNDPNYNKDDLHKKEKIQRSNLVLRTHSRRFLYEDKMKAADLNSITTVKKPPENDQVIEFHNSLDNDFASSAETTNSLSMLLALENLCLIKLLF